MTESTALHAWSTRPRPALDRDAVHRQVAIAGRRTARRHRLAERVRAVADRLEA